MKIRKRRGNRVFDGIENAKVISFMIEEETLKSIDKLAEGENLARSEYLRKLIDKGLQIYYGEDKELMDYIRKLSELFHKYEETQIMGKEFYDNVKKANLLLENVKDTFLGFKSYFDELEEEIKSLRRDVEYLKHLILKGVKQIDNSYIRRQ